MTTPDIRDTENMKISVLDGSNYFKGLLLLLRKDRKLAPEEVDLVQRVGISLGFELEFCNAAIHDILDNAHINDTPPQFSTPQLALKFIKDGLRIAHSDFEVHPDEIGWLEATALRNGLRETTVQQELERLLADPRKDRLEAEGVTVQF